MCLAHVPSQLPSLVRIDDVLLAEVVVTVLAVRPFILVRLALLSDLIFQGCHCSSGRGLSARLQLHVV